MADPAIGPRFPDHEVEQARRQTLYLAASLRLKGLTPNLTADLAPGDSPALDYLSRYIQLVRLLTHGQRLFRDLLPRIRRVPGVSSEPRQEDTRLEVRGRLDIPTTFRRAARLGEQQPTTFSVQRPEREYATSGNQLVALTLLMLHKQIDGLVTKPRTGLTHFEKKTLRALADQASAGLRQQEFQAAAAKLGQESRRDPDSPAARRLEEEVARKAGRTQEVPANYQEVVKWRSDWREYLVGTQGALFRAPQVENEDYELYELLVLLEIAIGFARRARRARQTRGRGEYGIPTFELELNDGRKVFIWFQATKTIWVTPTINIRPQPDLIIELEQPERCAILIEAKSIWSPDGELRSTHREALNELMAYMFNFGHPDRWHTLRGLVVFPHPTKERFPMGYHQLPMERPGRPWLDSLIIPLTGVGTAHRAAVDSFVDSVLTGDG